MSEHEIVPWGPVNYQVVPAGITDPARIANHAVQLKKRDIDQIVGAFQHQHYEMATTFIWSRAIAALKNQLGTLGSEFIGEMLQRPDIGANADIASAVTDLEAISLAEDLGVVTKTDAMRLRQSHEVIGHFAQFGNDIDEDAPEQMTPEEAVGCLRSCINSVLGRPNLEVAKDFAEFRRKLEERTFRKNDEEILGILGSPYFYLKTTLSVLLSLLKKPSGAGLEHAVRNATLILPLIWPKLRKPEKWQAGQTYAELYAEGKKEALAGLKSALSEVSGFDFVPENLRSATYTKAAKEVLEAHQSFNNFYNEASPMSALASLGSTIPSPAFPICMTATLCVRLGNIYGYARAAQPSATSLLSKLSKERWIYYLDEVLPRDKEVLVKLGYNKPASRWIETCNDFGLDSNLVSNKDIKDLLKATKRGKVETINKIAAQISKNNP